MNLKKVYRLYREERVTVRKRSGRERALGTGPPVAFIPRHERYRLLARSAPATAHGRRSLIPSAVRRCATACRFTAGVTVFLTTGLSDLRCSASVTQS